MKKIVRALLLLATVGTLFLCVLGAEAGAVGPVTKIGVLSDLHITSSTAVQDKMRDCLNDLMAESGGLNAVAFSGDLTDNGTPSELRLFRSICDETLGASLTPFTAAMGNHEFYMDGWGVDVNANPGLTEEMQQQFEDIIGVGLEDELVVNGIHILSVSPDNEMDSYQAREAFLKSKIQAAAAENGQAPILIVAHKPVRYTVMTSGEAPHGDYTGLAGDWSEDFLNFLKGYPQVIYFSGHAHDDIGDENTIYQEDFTSVQAGVTSGSPSTGLLVTVDENYVVTIERRNFTDDTVCGPNWVIDIPAVIADKANFTYRKTNTVKDVALTAGSDQSTLNVSWLNSTAQQGAVEIAKASDLTDSRTVAAADYDRSLDTGYFYNHAVIGNLEPETVYMYRVGNENGWSPYYRYETGAAEGSFEFIVAGDPQIGSGGGNPSDEVGWQATLAKALGTFPNSRFLVSLGDQVNVGSSTSQYDSFFSSELLRSIPLLTVVGNHDVTSSAYSQYFYYPQASAYGQTSLTGASSGDYSYMYNNTLIMVLNSNSQNFQAHRNFMQQAILDAGSAAKWKVVVFHHSIFSAGGHSMDADVETLREGLAPMLSDLDIDLVMAGHDHIYTRSYMMSGTTPDASHGVQSSVTNPASGQVVYFTLTSSSGSKFYDPFGDHDYDAVALQNDKPQFSTVEVSDTGLTVTTYNVSDLSVVDSFAINKTAASAGDTVKPYLFLPVDNTVLVGSAFDPMAGVSAADDDGTDLTAAISYEGQVDTGTKGTYTLTYRVTDRAGNTTTLTRSITVVTELVSETGLYYGLDIASGEIKDEDGTIPSITYSVPESFQFLRDETLGQTVLQLPSQGYAEISGLNMGDLGDAYTIELYVNIPSSSQSSGTGYEIFQIGNQNINICGFSDPVTYFGSGRSTQGDADVSVPAGIPADQWVHIVCTAKEGKQICYINGQVFAQEGYTGFDCNSGSDSVLRLGGSAYGRIGGMKLAYFRIYSGYSTEEQVAQMNETLMARFAPADYTAVDEALGAVPRDLSVYTQESAAALSAAVNQVDRSKKANEQDTVNAMAQAITAATQGLVMNDASYVAVDAALGQVPKDLTPYTQKSVQALNAAVGQIVRGKKINEQAVVDAMAQAVENAVKGLAYQETGSSLLPGTGDGEVLYLAAIVAVLSGASLAGIVLYKKKTRKER